MKQKSILITGASSGIGEALAKHYATENAMLFICGRNQDRIKQVADECRKTRATIHETVLDVTNKKELTDWITRSDDQHPLDLVIANAGISGGTGGMFEGEKLEDAEKIWNINLYGKINTVHAILPRMIKRRSGQIAVMASLAGFSGWPGAPSYSASKGAVRLYGEALRGTMKPLGVKINVICPGFVKSRMTAVNDYHMPFLMDTDKAAALIAKKLKRNVGRIAFPWPTYFFSGLIGMLPYWLSSKFLMKAPQKPAKDINCT